MMKVLEERFEVAENFVRRARAEETPEGNPLIAARNYLTAMEIIVKVCNEYAGSLVEKRRFFLYQMRHRLEVYSSRVRLLLQVAAEMGLDDSPEVVTTAGYSPCTAGAASPCPAVSSGPLRSSVEATAAEVDTQSREHMTKVPPVELFFSGTAEPLAALAPPPPETVPIESLLDQFTFDDTAKE
uniref:Uncharacterized protein TCIL3000_11_7130 n=1 Tax=Trypanosoma congolense (strain IL3000) TaxID=1068625 RepID=G0V0W2_TRYCI|nr:unnamed protein product [Trypanosoma congolense IL3000]